MSAVAPTQSADMVETAPPSPQRGDLLLNEIAQIEADLANLTPAARAGVRTVLESLLHEGELPPATAAAARQLLREITGVRPSTANAHLQTGLKTIIGVTVRHHPPGPVADS